MKWLQPSDVLQLQQVASEDLSTGKHAELINSLKRKYYQGGLVFACLAVAEGSDRAGYQISFTLVHAVPM